MTGSSSSTSHNNSSATTAFLSDSVVFADEQPDALLSIIDHDENECGLFDEIDDLYPHYHEGGKVVSSDRHHSASVPPGYDCQTCSLYTSYFRSRSHGREDLANSSITQLTEHDSLAASSNDGTLTEMIARMDDRFKMSVNSNSIGNLSEGIGDDEKRDSIVGGRTVSQMSFDEQWELFAPNRRKKSLVLDVGLDDSEISDLPQCENIQGRISYAHAVHDESIVSSVDWSSLTKSCKLAKTAFCDLTSGQNVVNNMFLSHLRPLTAVLTLYVRRHCSRGVDIEEEPCSLVDTKSHLTEVKRALQFATACLTLPHREDLHEEGEGQELFDVVECYRIARQFRQELQEATVSGFTTRAPSLKDVDAEHTTSAVQCRHYYGLHFPLVKIIHSDSPTRSPDNHATTPFVTIDDEDTIEEMVSSIERGKQRVRFHAARLLCNIVTDSPLAAEIVLRDVPFSPSPDLIDRRMTGLIFGSRDSVYRQEVVDVDGMIYWTDLVASTAKVHKASDSGGDREVLGVVVAALHNLFTSLEARELLLELDDEMKRRERSKKRREELRHEVSMHRRMNSRRNSLLENQDEYHSKKPKDVGVEVASDGVLLNTLLRCMLPARAVIMQSEFKIERKELSRPQFIPPISADDISDSATEWISLILERIASRGLLPEMLRSAGGKSNFVTPEQVVLLSCIRQTVDEYCSTVSPTKEEIQSSSMAVTTRPHPLWGRSDLSAGGRSSSTHAVPVLLSLANEVEEIRVRADALRQAKSIALYDGEEDCAIHMIDDLCDIIAQSLGRHAGTNVKSSKRCFTADARSVLGRETSIISSCCKDIGRILDRAVVANAGRKAREMMLSPQDQQTAIVMIRLVGNIVYQCRYNQDLLRITTIPVLKVEVADEPSTSSNIFPSTNCGLPIERTGLHVLLSATSLAPACFTLREWCIVAIRNAVEGNDANAETIRRLEANQVLSDTPELRQMGLKIGMDAKGNVQVKKSAQGPIYSEAERVNWA